MNHPTVLRMDLTADRRPVTDGSLALALSPTPPALRSGGGIAPVRPLDPATGAPDGSPQRCAELATLAQTDASVRCWATQYVCAALEVMDGSRPLQQLMRLTSADVYADLGRRAELLHQARDGRIRVARSRLLSVRVCCLSETVSEVSAHVRHGGRSRAVALRFEFRARRWWCTACDFV